MAGRGGKKDDVLSRLLARSSWAAYRSRAHQLPHQALVSANLPPSLGSSYWKSFRPINVAPHSAAAPLSQQFIQTCIWR